MSTARALATEYLSEVQFRQMWVVVFLTTLAGWLGMVTLHVFSMQGLQPSEIQRLLTLMEVMVFAPVVIAFAQPALIVGLRYLTERGSA